jgi:hypothetical protein
LAGEGETKLGPTMAELWDAAGKIGGDSFAALKSKVNYDPAAKNIELLLSHCQMSESLKSEPQVASFVRDTEKMIVSSCRFVKKETLLSNHEAFLRKTARRSARLPRMKLFTTNYDLCFERASSRTQFIVIDGFSHTQPQEFDGSHFSYDLVRREQEKDAPDYIPNVFHLHKMHGSVDWRQDEGVVVRDPDAPRPLIIYPRVGKFESSYGQPYLEMMARFQFALRQPKTGVLIIGFGFNDNHVVQPILSAIRANVGLKLMAVSPHIADSENAAIKQITALIKAGDWRLSLVNASFKEFVGVIPDLVQQTEQEQHFARVRAVGHI